ncbi:MAG: ANTAR domain-containing protein [Actinomycetota bacterium]|nr:ANTAR domain-containing protein [Actinomycetota bacterium]
MSSHRLLRILAMVSANGGEPVPARLCQVAAEVTAATCGGIMLVDGALPRASLCSTDPLAAYIEGLQHTLGEGPGIDAHALGGPVAEPDLAEPAVARWPAFAAPAVAAGVRAVFGFPVRIGAVRLGALDLYRDRPGPLTADQHADALVLADVAARAVLSLQVDVAPGTLAPELDVGADWQLVVHQAAGMVSVQLAVTVAEALVRLRAQAFARNRLVAEVAQDVVDRRLRFDQADGPDDP